MALFLLFNITLANNAIVHTLFYLPFVINRLSFYNYINHNNYNRLYILFVCNNLIIRRSSTYPP